MLLNKYKFIGEDLLPEASVTRVSWAIPYSNFAQSSDSLASIIVSK